MISYRDKTFCPATECQQFETCPSALTDSVRHGAELWWGKPGAPISVFDRPKALKCYRGDEAKEEETPKQPKTLLGLKRFFGATFDPKICGKIITDQSGTPYQCGHPNGKGLKGLWCTRHIP